MTTQGRKMLMQKTIDHLYSIGYKLKDIDIQFLKKYNKQINQLNLKI